MYLKSVFPGFGMISFSFYFCVEKCILGGEMVFCMWSVWVFIIVFVCFNCYHFSDKLHVWVYGHIHCCCRYKSVHMFWFWFVSIFPSISPCLRFSLSMYPSLCVSFFQFYFRFALFQSILFWLSGYLVLSHYSISVVAWCLNDVCFYWFVQS